LQTWFDTPRGGLRPADAILVLGAAEYRGRPSPVFKARLDDALDLYERQMAPVLITTGGAGRNRPVHTLSDSDLLEAPDLLPGFSVPVSDLFA
jgi:hypothetical protein